MKTVLITGGTRGIGKSIAIDFAKNNYQIILLYSKDDNSANETKEELEEKYNSKVSLYKCDISDENKVSETINTILNNDNIDVLINNASIAIDEDFFTKNLDNFKRVLNVNLIGTYLVSRLIGKHMLDNKSGRIVNIASNNGIDQNYPESVDYDASKAGVISLTHNLARTLMPYVNVNAVCPGWVNTNMNKDMDNNFKKTEESKIMLGRFAEPNDIAGVVYFLTTEEACYINDSIIRVDGGIK